MKLWRSWVALFDRREAATTLAVLRIGVGLCLLANLGIAAADGMVELLWVDPAFGGFATVRSDWLFDLVGGATPRGAWTLFALAVAGAMLVVVGLGARIAAVVASLCFGALVTSQADTSGGADMLITNGLWLLALSRCDETLSLWCRLRRGRWRSEREVPSWPRYVFIFQLVVVYFAAGVQKTAGVWTPGGGYLALHYVFQDPTWIRFSDDAFLWASPLTRVGSAVTWHWEHLTPLLLVYFWCAHTRERGGRLRRWMTRFDLRKPWMAVGVALHLGILVFLDVGVFSLAAVTYYAALWRPAEIERAATGLLERLKKRGGRDKVSGDDELSNPG